MKSPLAMYDELIPSYQNPFPLKVRYPQDIVNRVNTNVMSLREWNPVSPREYTFEAGNACLPCSCTIPG